MKLTLKTLPHAKQRYNTVGDYTLDRDLFEGEEVWRFTVTETEDWRSQAAIFLHEFVEAMLCKERGITPEAVDDFDMGPLGRQSEDPGDHPQAPYAKEHRFAENLERLLIAELGLTWAEHEEEVKRATRPP